MQQALKTLLDRYELQSDADYENALKEIIQHLALLGLWRSKFFEHAAFYGGACLRIFYGLRRFSEDLDFSLLAQEESFNIRAYMSAIEKELESSGFTMNVEQINKATSSQIESDFIKRNTKKNLLSIEAPEHLIDRLPENKKLKIKFEIDIDPPHGAEYEVKTLLTPIPFSVKLFSQADLFAGKLHAILCRKWKNRVKGRDYYDFVWYIAQNIPCRLSHLASRMIQTGHLETGCTLDSTQLKQMLQKQFESVDFEQARYDVRPFLRDSQELDLWSGDFFLALIDRIMTV